MLEKLKNLGTSVKEVFIFLVTPLMLLVAYIIYLMDKNRDLKLEAEKAKQEAKLTETTVKKVEAEHEAIKDELDYAKLRDEYLKQQQPKS